MKKNRFFDERPYQGSRASTETSYAIPIPKHPKYGQYYRVPVCVTANDSRLCSTRLRKWIWVRAKTATEAANWVRDRLDFIPEIEIDAYGPKGGRVSRYIGWGTAVASNLMSREDELVRLQEARELLFGGDSVLSDSLSWLESGEDHASHV